MKRLKYKVLDTTYHCHREPDDSTVVEIRYVVSHDGVRQRSFSEYLDFESQSMSHIARQWWERNAVTPYPDSNQHAVDIMNYHGVGIVEYITVSHLGKDMSIGGTVLDKSSELTDIQ